MSINKMITSVSLWPIKHSPASSMTGWSFSNGHESYYSSVLWSSKFLWPCEFSYFVNSLTVTSHTQHFPPFPVMCKMQTSSLLTSGGGRRRRQDQVGLGPGMRRRQGGLKKSLPPCREGILKKSLMQPAPLLAALTPGIQLLSPTAQPTVGFKPVWGNKSPGNKPPLNEVQPGCQHWVAWMLGCPLPGSLQLYSSLLPLPFLCTLQIQVRQPANPLPLHTVRCYPHSMPVTSCQTRQKHCCMFAI